MICFDNILAVYNGTHGSEAVLEQAIAVARAQNARLTLLRHVGPDETEDLAHMRLRRIVPWIVQQGVAKVETAVAVDQSAQNLVRRVDEAGHDLVILNAATNAPLRNALFGNIATSLMGSCPCPTWVLPPEQTTPCTRIVAAVGDDDGDPKSREINSGIIGLGVALAHSQEAELHIVHAWTPAPRDAELLTNEIADERRESILKRNEFEHRRSINRILEKHDVSGLEHQIHLPRGLPQNETVALAKKVGADVIVMGKTYRTGMPRFVFGDPAKTVLGTAGCGILTVDAKGIDAAPFHTVEMPLAEGRLRAVGSD
jgi:nucleotide-binding universal stress UspA family protein